MTNLLEESFNNRLVGLSLDWFSNDWFRK